MAGNAVGLLVLLVAVGLLVLLVAVGVLVLLVCCWSVDAVGCCWFALQTFDGLSKQVQKLMLIWCVTQVL